MTFPTPSFPPFSSLVPILPRHLFYHGNPFLSLLLASPPCAIPWQQPTFILPPLLLLHPPSNKPPLPSFNSPQAPPHYSNVALLSLPSGTPVASTLTTHAPPQQGPGSLATRFLSEVEDLNLSLTSRPTFSPATLHLTLADSKHRRLKNLLYSLSFFKHPLYHFTSLWAKMNAILFLWLQSS